MSNRQMARIYSGAGNVGFPSVGNPDEAGLLTKLFGKDAISGGPSIGPDGKVVYGEYNGSSGFLGGHSRNQASQLNQALKMMMLQQQLQESGLINVENARGKNTIANTQEQGKNTLAEVRTKQQADVLGRKDIPLDDTNLASFNSKVTPHLLTGAEIGAQNEIGRQGWMKDRYADPASKAAFLRGMIANDLTPEARNFNAMTVPVAKDSMTLFPEVPGMNYSTARGPTSNEENTIVGGITDPKTGVTMGGKPFNRSYTNPGFVSPSPAAIKAALEAQNGNAAMSNPIDSDPFISTDSPPKAIDTSIQTMPNKNNGVLNAGDYMQTIMQWLSQQQQQKQQSFQMPNPYK
jgi:hypothetical protein